MATGGSLSTSMVDSSELGGRPLLQNTATSCAQFRIAPEHRHVVPSHRNCAQLPELVPEFYFLATIRIGHEFHTASHVDSITDLGRLSDESCQKGFPAGGGGSRRFPRLFAVADIVFRMLEVSSVIFRSIASVFHIKNDPGHQWTPVTASPFPQALARYSKGNSH